MLFEDRNYLTVSEVNAQVRALVETNYAEVAVGGEVSNCRRHTSGHLYFTLKDSDSQLRAVCFRRDAEQLGFEIDDGMQVIARGRLTVYEPYGQYQLVAYAIEPAGAGALELAFRALCEKLEGEGLFDDSHKKPLPPFPFRIAVVTSPTGAAVRDIVSTIHRRWPVPEVLLFPVRVQGEEAAAEIVRALEVLSERSDLDLVIVGRGGGSLEDLWAFNEEGVARAVHACRVPVVSAVGHERDFTIADFVADARAATPTMAAEIAVPHLTEVAGSLDAAEARLLQFAADALDRRRARLQEMLRSYALGQVRSRIERNLQAHDYAMEKLRRSVIDVVRNQRSRLSETLTQLSGLDPSAILRRGYAICSDPKAGTVIRTTAAALEADRMKVTFADGSVMSEVKEKVDERR